MPMPALWTPEQENRLIDLIADGLSCGSISDISNQELGSYFTRNAVCGKIARLRKELGRDDLRAGLSVGRMYILPGHGKQTVESKLSILRLLEWKRKHGVKAHPRSNHGVVSALMGAEGRRRAPNRKVERRIAMLNMNDYPNAVHLLERDHWKCPWPLWCDETPFSEKLYCGNPIEKGCHYCQGHNALAHDARLPGEFRTQLGRKANKWTVVGWGRAA